MKLNKDDRVYIKTKSGGRIAMNNLRPGDWVDGGMGVSYVVLQNSAVLGRAEFRYPLPGVVKVWPHSAFNEADTYLGRGKKRWWYERLPRCIRKHFMPYSKPE